ncbi:MAG: DUF29 domain-containing protein [Candidatus Binataceae bacterium]
MAETKKFVARGPSSEQERPAVHRDDDPYAWLRNQASILRARHYGALDSTNLAEELEEMAALQRDKVVSLLRVVLVHLLKWRYSRIRRSEHSWRTSIVTARVDVTDILEGSRTLRNEIPALTARAYRGARPVAGAQMRPDKRTWLSLFPNDSPWSALEVLDEDFFPEMAPGSNGLPSVGENRIKRLFQKISNLF